MMRSKDSIKKIAHVNPNCRDARCCAPHGSRGEVFYRAEALDRVREETREIDRLAVVEMIEDIEQQYGESTRLKLLKKVVRYKLTQKEREG